MGSATDEIGEEPTFRLAYGSCGARCKACPFSSTHYVPNVLSTGLSETEDLGSYWGVRVGRSLGTIHLWHLYV